MNNEVVRNMEEQRIGNMETVPRIVHKQENIEINGNTVPIDKGIVLLISELNRVGLETHASCEGSDPGDENDDNFAYISILLKNAHFDYNIDRDILTIRWNRYKTHVPISEPIISLDSDFLYMDDIVRMINICRDILENPVSTMHYKDGRDPKIE